LGFNVAEMQEDDLEEFNPVIKIVEIDKFV
jgi:hypothetical protein